MDKNIIFPKILITGCPRSGTMFMANLLTQGGLVCGHETRYGFPAMGTWKDGMIADSSWPAAPHLCQINKKDRIIIQIVRNPLKVISSLKVVDFFEDHSFKGNPLVAYINVHMPDLQHYSVLDRYILFWVRWNQTIEEHTNFIYRLEDLVKNPYELFKDLKHDIGDTVINTKKVNYHIKKKELTLDDFSNCEHFNELVRGMKHYKYKVPKDIKPFMKGEVVI